MQQWHPDVLTGGEVLDEPFAEAVIARGVENDRGIDLQVQRSRVRPRECRELFPAARIETGRAANAGMADGDVSSLVEDVAGIHDARFVHENASVLNVETGEGRRQQRRRRDDIDTDAADEARETNDEGIRKHSRSVAASGVPRDERFRRARLPCPTVMMQSEINVTPLVDVCLVLLIIFMVVLPTVVTGVPVQLPETRHGESLADSPLAITVKSDSTVFVGGNVVHRESLDAELQRQRAEKPARGVAVRADKRVEYGEVVSVLDACRKAGWEDVKLVSFRAIPEADGSPR